MTFSRLGSHWQSRGSRAEAPFERSYTNWRPGPRKNQLRLELIGTQFIIGLLFGGAHAHARECSNCSASAQFRESLERCAHFHASARSRLPLASEQADRLRVLGAHLCPRGSPKGRASHRIWQAGRMALSGGRFAGQVAAVCIPRHGEAACCCDFICAPLDHTSAHLE